MNNKKHTHWVKLAKLKYDVRGTDGRVLLKAGTKNVYVAFRCGCFVYTDAYGNRVRANKYRDSVGRIYYGH